MQDHTISGILFILYISKLKNLLSIRCTSGKVRVILEDNEQNIYFYKNN